MKTKTLRELFKEYDDWKQTFRRGAYGDQEAYAKARDTRGYFEEGKWVCVGELKQELKELDGMYCLSELATGEKCDRYNPNRICSVEEANDCDFRCVRVRIRELLAGLEATIK